MKDLTSYKKFHDLKKLAEGDLSKIGFTCEFRLINELNNRYRLARSFEGLKLTGYREETIAGYEALTQVFLSHSALEMLIGVLDCESMKDLEPLLIPYNPESIIVEFVKADYKKRLFEFLIKRMENESISKQLTRVYEGESSNVFQISRSIRNIFAHGHLTAHANSVNPKKMQKMCKKLSDFTLDFIDSEFTNLVNKND